MFLSSALHEHLRTHWTRRFTLGDNAPQVSGVKVYQSEASGADEVIMELDFGWSSDAEMSMIVHPMPHQAWLATPVVEVLSKLIVVKVRGLYDAIWVVTQLLS